jgi:uncharacterized SAM-binding protein YcdF (DUF218 family)
VKSRSRAAGVIVAAAVLLLAAALFLAAAMSTQILSGLGSYLVQAGPPEKADAALVLAGDSSGNRILTAAELMRQGYVRKVVVSGPGGNYGLHECDLAIPFAVKKGYPQSYFEHAEHFAHSTVDEARAVVPQLRRDGYRRIELVTSDYHTRRAAKVFRDAAPDLTFFVVAAPDPYFTAGGWWHNREGQKTFLTEWEKTVARWIGL